MIGAQKQKTPNEWIMDLALLSKLIHDDLRPLSGIAAVDDARSKLWGMYDASERFLKLPERKGAHAR